MLRSPFLGCVRMCVVHFLNKKEPFPKSPKRKAPNDGTFPHTQTATARIETETAHPGQSPGQVRRLRRRLAHKCLQLAANERAATSTAAAAAPGSSNEIALLSHNLVSDPSAPRWDLVPRDRVPMVTSAELCTFWSEVNRKERLRRSQ